MLFLPESPRYLMHKGKPVEAYKVWKRIRGVESADAKEEFFVMKVSVQEEARIVAEGATNKRFPWLDFFTQVTLFLNHSPHLAPPPHSPRLTPKIFTEPSLT
jgi:hypothetical protein